jgi:hypothetical protein
VWALLAPSAISSADRALLGLWRLAVLHTILMGHPTVLKSKITARTTLVGEVVFGHYYPCATIGFCRIAVAWGTELKFISSQTSCSTVQYAEQARYTIHMYPSPSRLLPIVFVFRRAMHCGVRRAYPLFAWPNSLALLSSLHLKKDRKVALFHLYNTGMPRGLTFQLLSGTQFR